MTPESDSANMIEGQKFPSLPTSAELYAENTRLRGCVLAMAQANHREHYLGRRYHGRPGDRSFNLCKHELCIMARAALNGEDL